MDDKLQRKIIFYLGAIVLFSVAGFVVSLISAPQYTPGGKAEKAPVEAQEESAQE